MSSVHMPSLDGASGWLNSEPLSPAALRGRVVLVDFWTLTCINWLRTEPWIRGWSRAYRDDGLTVIVNLHDALSQSSNAANQRRADARNPKHIYGRCALAAFAC